MVRLSWTRGISACLAVLISALNAAAIAADNSGAQSITNGGFGYGLPLQNRAAAEKPFTIALADLPKGFANAGISPSPERQGQFGISNSDQNAGWAALVTSIWPTQFNTAHGGTSAPWPAAPRTTTPYSTVPRRSPDLQPRSRTSSSPRPAMARFFTINGVLARRQLLTSRVSPFKLAAIERTGPVSDAPPLQIPQTQSSEPFGLFTFRAPDGPLWMKWRSIKAAIRTEAPALARCRAEPNHCTPAEARFVSIVKDAAATRGRVRLSLVNQRVNAAIRYTTDWAQWHVPDRWSAPLDRHKNGSFDTGRGDCEDYAIAKYVALRAAGLAPDRLQIILVRDNWVHMDHAVLAVRNKGHWLVLDNRWPRLIEDTDLKRFEPLFAINDEGVELFAAPYAAKGGTANQIEVVERKATQKISRALLSLPTPKVDHTIQVPL